MTEEKLLTKIQALLAKAESTNHPEEAQAFTAKAAELMSKYSVSERALAGYRRASSNDVESTRLDMGSGSSPFLGPKSHLLAVAANHNDCTVVFEKGRLWNGQKYTKTCEAVIFGFAADREFTEALYTSLLVQADVEFQSPKVQAQMAAETWEPGNRIKWRNAYTLGYVGVVAARLAAVKREARSSASRLEGPGVGLVLAHKDDLVKDAVAKAYPKVGHSRSRAGQSWGSGAHLGAEAGRRADLGQRAQVGSGG